MANDEGSIDLYYKNTRFKKKDVDSPVWGYHLQKAFYKDMTSFSKYIVDHDKYRFSYLDKPLKPKGGKKPRLREQSVGEPSKKDRKNVTAVLRSRMFTIFLRSWMLRELRMR